MAKSDGSLVIPDKSTFFEKNVKVFQQDFRIFVDTTPSADSNTMTTGTITISNPFYYKNSSGKVERTVNSTGDAMTYYSPWYKYYQLCWWTDCEVKVIDKWGNLVYFTSTIALSNKQVQMLHPDLCDSTPKIFAWVAVAENDNGGCWGQRKELTNFNSSIGATFGDSISGIWIYPDVSSTAKRRIPIFTGANVYSMQAVVWGTYVREVFNNPDNTILVWRQTKSVGELYNDNKLWRPARLEYYGDFKEVK
jgi:hypothetical protein